MIFYLQYRVWPKETHPQGPQMGEGMVCCWIDRPTLPEADRVARREIDQSDWEILEREIGEEAEADNNYYEQAVTDKEVFLYNLSPRHPVYWVIAAVARDNETAEAHYLLAGAALVESDDELYTPDFWSKHDEAVASAAIEAIEAEGWRVTHIIEQRPCGPPDIPDDLIFAYDEAEDSGSCLVFAHEEP